MLDQKTQAESDISETMKNNDEMHANIDKQVEQIRTIKDDQRKMK